MKAIWNGHISFGLISIPISVHSAVESTERVSFRLLHRKDHAPIRFKKFCSKEDIEVPNDEIVRGFEVDDDEFAEVEKEELDRVEDESSPDKGVMEVLQFVDFASLESPLLRPPVLRRSPQGRRKGLRRSAGRARRSPPHRDRPLPAP